MDILLQRLEKLERNLANLLRYGTIHAVDYREARVRVKLGPELITGWLPWFTQRAGPDRHWSAPEPGEQVMVLAPGGELQLGAALPAIFQNAHPAPAQSADVMRVAFNDAANMEYDRAAHRLTITLPTGGEAHLTGDVKIVGNVDVTGSITASADITAANEVTADTIKLTDHKHGGVVPGGAQTGTPV